MKAEKVGDRERQKERKKHVGGEREMEREEERGREREKLAVFSYVARPPTSGGG